MDGSNKSGPILGDGPGRIVLASADVYSHSPGEVSQLGARCPLKQCDEID